jgi:hypothetical protein
MSATTSKTSKTSKPATTKPAKAAVKAVPETPYVPPVVCTSKDGEGFALNSGSGNWFAIRERIGRFLRESGSDPAAVRDALAKAKANLDAGKQSATVKVGKASVSIKVQK